MTSKIRVYAPNTAYNGLSAGVQFANGVGEVDPAATGAIAYFRRAGYGVGERPTPATPATADYTGPQPSTVQGGTALRDAAVDPEPTDFLPPTNAGHADPHGPLVVSPQVHADGPKGIRPGDVLVHDAARQNVAETALAQSALVEGQDKGVAVEAADTPIDRSAEAEAARGRGPLVEAQPLAAAPPAPGEAPSKGASQAAWVDHAVASGADRAQAEDMKRADLIEKYG